MSFLICDMSEDVATWSDLRVAPVFAIWVVGSLSAAFPILAHRSSVARVRVPRTLFEYAFLCILIVFFLSRQILAQVRQIFQFWRHYRHGVYPPPFPRPQRAHLAVSWRRMEYSCAQSIFYPSVIP